MALYSQAEKLMETWSARGLISEEGKDWLTACLDPFHDAQLQHLAGYPDIETSPSVVRLVKQSMTLTCPTTIPGNWDCLIVQWPWFDQRPFAETVPSVGRQNNQLFSWSPIQPLGGLQAFAVPSGSPFDLSDPAVLSLGSIVLTQPILQGSKRLVGCGFEIHNTTAEIYKQGAICNFMMHNVPRDASAFLATQNFALPAGGMASAVSNIFNGTSFRAPPTTTAEALLIPGSNEWAAKDGVYVTCRFQGVDNPPFTVDYNLPVLFDTDDVPGGIGVNTSQIFFPIEAVTPASAQAPAFSTFPIHTSGCIMTGLSNQTSLRLNSNVFIEAFPGPRQQLDLSIATPSASFDPRALEIYSHTLGHAPIAVPVGENPLGEWFMDMVGKVGNFLGNMGGIPGAIGNAASAIAGTMKPFMTSPSGTNQNKPKKKQPKKSVAAPAPRNPARNGPGVPPQKPVKTYTSTEWQAMSNAQRKQARNMYRVNINEMISMNRTRGLR